MVAIRRVEPQELTLARDLHNRFTAQDRSMATVRSWYEAVPDLFLFAEPDSEGGPIGICTGRPVDESDAGGDSEAVLAGLGLEPDRRGEGIGTRLVETFHANAAAMGIDRVSVGSAGGYVDEFYAACGYEPECLLVMTSPAALPEDYRDLGYDIVEERTDDGVRKLYIDVEGLDQSFREDAGAAFGADEAIYIMAKELSSH